MPARTIAVGDVHGCAKALNTVIDAIRPTPDDLIVTLGDYVNRGPDSRGVLDALAALQSRCRLVPLLGNHDEMLLQARTGRPTTAATVAESLRRGRPPRDWTRELARLTPENWAFLESCRSYHETEDHLFLHAAYDPAQPLSRQPDALLRWHSLRNGIPGPHYSGKVAVVGHSSQKNGKILNLGHIICIDTYCHGGGWLTGLDVHTGQAWQSDRNGRLRTRRGPR
ncbi:metallophosphoesterase family protein [Paludisphaera mucosa]|uniref:Metallophosphoesterase family protein n=1 Tax=Paludisphaera mucosa TaxID=3030827 RepID=A0ABT6F800_9BACT|nr:metallophosphoesterase family protein [Paludisphaera mucosa]MDG3003713.1 metallophosphoesterase family protein [Paludisphaera mucosa]